MKIVHITRMANELHAVLDNNAVVRISDIKGSPRVGCNVDINEDGWSVIGNDANADCMSGGACDYNPPQGK